MHLSFNFLLVYLSLLLSFELNLMNKKTWHPSCASENTEFLNIFGFLTFTQKNRWSWTCWGNLSDSLALRYIVHEIFKFFSNIISVQFWIHHTDWTIPSVPGLNFFVKFLARAFDSTTLAMSHETIFPWNVSFFKSILDQLFGLLQSNIWGEVVQKTANETYPNRALVVVLCVCSLDVPAPSFIDATVGAYKEVISYVWPFPAVYVERLYESNK